MYRCTTRFNARHFKAASTAFSLAVAFLNCHMARAGGVMTAGGTMTFPAMTTGVAEAYHEWTITTLPSGPTYSAHFGSSSGGWTVTGSASSLTVTAPTGVTGTYKVDYGSTTTMVPGQGSDPTGPIAYFAIPTTLPVPRPGSAYSYEATSGGVNLATGNKMTSFPIVSWKA